MELQTHMVISDEQKSVNYLFLFLFFWEGGCSVVESGTSQTILRNSTGFFGGLKE